MSLKELGELPIEPHVCIPRARYEALMAENAKLRALLWANHVLLEPLSYEDNSLLASQVRENRAFFAALRAAGICMPAQ